MWAGIAAIFLVVLNAGLSVLEVNLAEQTVVSWSPRRRPSDIVFQ